MLANELRVTAGYRFRYHHPLGRLGRRFREISPPRCLVFTWTWEPPDPHAGIETLVTIELSEDRGGTMVVVTPERFPDSASRGRHRSGWASTLPRLSQVLRSSSPAPAH